MDRHVNLVKESDNSRRFYYRSKKRILKTMFCQKEMTSSSSTRIIKGNNEGDERLRTVVIIFNS